MGKKKTAKTFSNKQIAIMVPLVFAAGLSVFLIFDYWEYAGLPYPLWERICHVANKHGFFLVWITVMQFFIYSGVLKGASEAVSNCSGPGTLTVVEEKIDLTEQDRKTIENIRKYKAAQRIRRENKKWWQFWI